MQDIPSIGNNIKPIWQRVNELGYRVGIMNVPTTNPAPKVKGFFVSGGGGGGSINQEVEAIQCYPQKIRHQLNDSGYILDERLPTLLGEDKLFEGEDFFSRLSKMASKRTDSFIELATQFTIDFGFVVYKSSSVTTETLLLPEYKKYNAKTKHINSSFITSAQKYYNDFDRQIKKLVESFPESEIMFVSDHGMIANKYSVNLNEFLIETSYQEKSKRRKTLYNTIKNMRAWIPYSVRSYLKKNPKIKSAYQSMVSFNPEKTQAFNITITRNTFGIFINDKKRFGGFIKEADISHLIQQIIDAFNRHPEVQKHQLIARKKTETTGDFSTYYPDIWIEMPDGYIPSNEYKHFFYQHDHSEPFDLRHFKASDLSEKSRTPLAVLINGTWKATPTPQKQDLRVIYDHIVETFQYQKDT
jgi:predicted AlkP superfamily phosphohydrolase/phosphomutase